MLFSSYEFILVFLPLTLGVFFLLRGRTPRGALLFLTLASLVFYGYWRALDVVVLLTSIAVNFLLGHWIAKLRGQPASKRLLTLGLVLNVGALGYFKYTGLLLDTLTRLTGHAFEIGAIALPLGISFFTFQQIAYLCDAHVGKHYEPDALHYTFFIVFFPHLIAGPIAHHAKVLPQLNDSRRQRNFTRNLALGFSVFAVGLFKKVGLADTIAPYSERVFDAAAAGVDLRFLEAWFGTVAFALQLYFDFSGYSDMAIGLALLFGLRWPLNFNSPYKARSITEFWRRWHMTLSRFLRDYLYIPLGGNRRGPWHQARNLMLTMLIGGIWHGASYRFLLWGGMHGAFLVVHRAWQVGLQRFELQLPRNSLLYVAAARGLTLAAVLLAWVPFQAAGMRAVLTLWTAMFGVRGLGSLPTVVSPAVLGTTFALCAVALFFPNTQQIFLRYRIATEAYPGEIDPPGVWSRLRFRPNLGWGLATTALFILAFIMMSGVSPFIYYQF